MTEAHKIYMGSCNVCGDIVLATSMSVGLEIRPAFYDHIFGLRDTDSAPGKGPNDGGTTQRTMFRYYPGVAKLNVSGLVLKNGLGGIWGDAKKGSECEGECDFGEETQSVTGVISTLTISCQAGEPANISVEIQGKDLGKKKHQRTNVLAKASCEAPLLWSDFEVSGAPGNEVVGFSITVNNSVKPVYLSTGDGFWPEEMRCGTQDISGTVTTIGGDDWAKEGNISFTGGSTDVIWGGSKYSGDVGGIYVATTPFTGYWA